MTTDPNTTADGHKLARGSDDDWCERWPTEGHSWSYTSHAGQPRITTRRCHSCGYVSVQPVREELLAPLTAENARLRQQRDEARAKVAVVEKQRDEAQEERDEAREDAAAARREADNVARTLTDAMAEQAQALAGARDEARAALDALVAEVQRIAGHMIAEATGPKTSLTYALTDYAGRLRQAIAKTAPQSPAGPPQATQDNEQPGKDRNRDR